MKVAWCDTEATFNEAWAYKLGVPIDLLGEDDQYLLDFPYPAEPETATMETWCAILLEVVKSNQYDLLVIDTWAHMSPRGEQETAMDKNAQMGLFAKATTRLYRMLSPWLPVSKTAVVIVNQVRNQFGDEYRPYTSPGGWALHHEASVRIQMYYPTTDYWDGDKNEPKQHTFRFYIEKTKVSDTTRKLHSIMLVHDREGDYWEYDQIAAIWDSIPDLGIFEDKDGQPWVKGKTAYFDAARWGYPADQYPTEQKDLNSNGCLKLENGEDKIRARINDDKLLLIAVTQAVNGTKGENDA